MGTAALVGAVLSSVPDAKGQNAKARKPQGVNEPAQGSFDRDEELEEFQRLEKAELGQNTQKKVNK